MIRPADASDVPEITALWNRVIRDTTITFTATPKTEAEITALVARQPVLVARGRSAFRGFATFAQFRGGDGYAHTMEHAIYLTDAARGQGLGRALLAELETRARAAGARSLIAGISGENRDGIGFHEATGFTHVGRIPEAGRKFGRYLDLILMQKHLSRR